MKQIEQLLQYLMATSVKDRRAAGVIKVDNHQFAITLEFQGYLEQAIDVEAKNSAKDQPIPTEDRANENTSVD